MKHLLLVWAMLLCITLSVFSQPLRYKSKMVQISQWNDSSKTYSILKTSRIVNYLDINNGLLIVSCDSCSMPPVKFKTVVSATRITRGLVTIMTDQYGNKIEFIITENDKGELGVMALVDSTFMITYLELSEVSEDYNL